MKKLTKEQLESARAAKTPEELHVMAKYAGIALTDEQAERFLQPSCELSDQELENVTGGACGESPPEKKWEQAAKLFFNNQDPNPVGHPCLSCKVSSNGKYSLYCESYNNYDLIWKRYWRVKCMACGASLPYMSKDGSYVPNK